MTPQTRTIGENFAETMGRTHFASATTPAELSALIRSYATLESRFLRVTNKHRSTQENKEIDATVERLREFIRLNYVSAGEVARRIGVTDSSVNLWLIGKTRPARPEQITTFLDSLPVEAYSGIAPVGYQYREYKNWRGIPKPRRCHFVSKQRARFAR